MLDLKVMNVCLLCKWLWKIENEDGLWQQVIRTKYLHTHTLSHVKLKASHSHFWSGLMKVRDIFFSFCRKVIGNGNMTRFWDDVWIGEKKLIIVFPRLYNLSHSKNVSVAKVMSEGWSVLNFRRNLWGDLAMMWTDLKELCRGVSLTNAEDKCRWTLTKSGQFSVKSLYNALKISLVKVPYRKLWFIKVPLKVKVFIWLAFRKSILTKDVLLARGWKGSDKCMFCSQVENIDHLFFTCPVARYIWNIAWCAFGLKSIPTSIDEFPRWIDSFTIRDRYLFSTGISALLWAIWKTWNNAYFNGVIPQDPTSVIYLMAHFISYWAALQKPGMREPQRRGARMLVMVATEFYHRSQGWGPLVRRLTGE